ncbi:zinc ribbon domain-containing protein [Candidatus Bathyarchaeota archaeon]|nr:zinc ribbon domain-containing protein [Candidatus Bathyarchaeota archaeon]
MRTLIRQKSALALSLIFCLLGIVILSFAIWTIYPRLFSGDPFSTFLSLLWTENLNLIPGLEFKLAYFVILGIAMLISGVIIGVLSRQWVVLPGKTVWFQCPFCNKKWRAIGDKALVHCPHCNQLVHPRMIEK